MLEARVAKLSRPHPPRGCAARPSTSDPKQSRLSRRVVVAALLVGLATGWLAPAPARADVRFAVTTSPAHVTYPGTRHVTFTLAMTSGAQAERLTVWMRTLRLADGGASMYFDGWSLVGPGRLLGSVGVFKHPGCSPHLGNPFHGAAPRDEAVSLELPPESTTRLLARYTTGVFAPWPGAPLGMTFAVDPARFYGPGRPTVTRAFTLTPPELALTAHRRGVRIDLFTRPHSATNGGARNPRVTPGRAISIFGRTTPRLPGQSLVLRSWDPGARSLTTIARVALDAQSRFHYRGWRPRKPGTYEIWAFYDRPAPGMVADHRCPRYVTIAP